jgi:hypothetical protein
MSLCLIIKDQLFPLLEPCRRSSCPMPVADPIFSFMLTHASEYIRRTARQAAGNAECNFTASIVKEQKATGRAIIGGSRRPLRRHKPAEPPPQSRGARVAAGPRPWIDAPFSHQVTKVYTFSFLAIPAIRAIVVETGRKQSGAASSLPQGSSPLSLVFSYSAKGKSHFDRSEKNTHLLALCDHNCARKAHKPAHPGLFDKKTPAARTRVRPLPPPN